MKGFIVLFFIGLVSGSLVDDPSLKNYSYTGICESVNHGVFEVLEECNKYILCLFKRELIVLCPPDTVFNRAIKDCIPGDPGSCGSTITPTPPTTTPTQPTTTTTTEPTTTTTEPTTTTTTEPTTTTTEPTTTTTTEPTTITTEPTTTTSTEPTTTTTEANTTPEWRDTCEQGQLGNVELSWTCRYYVFCFNKVASLRECPRNQIFVKTRCVPGDQETCIPATWGYE